MDVGAVQRVERPTRDVLVMSDATGDREFVGFGGPNDSFADTVIDVKSLPEDVLESASALVMGSLGLAFPATAAAMRRALEVAKRGSCDVRAPRSLTDCCVGAFGSLAQRVGAPGVLVKCDMGAPGSLLTDVPAGHPWPGSV